MEEKRQSVENQLDLSYFILASVRHDTVLGGKNKLCTVGVSTLLVQMPLIMTILFMSFSHSV